MWSGGRSASKQLNVPIAWADGVAGESEPLLCCEVRPAKDRSRPLGIHNDGRERVWNSYSVCSRLSLLALAVASLALNVVSLMPTLYFFVLEAEPPTIGHLIHVGPYNFALSLEILFRNGLWYIGVMLVLWTCIFPPLKLLTMCLAVTLRTSSGCRGVTLGILGQLARFSLLDVYFVALLMLMLTDQDHRILVIDVHLAVLARPAIFLYLAAILVSLTAGEIIEQIEISRHDHNHEPYHDSRLEAAQPIDAGRSAHATASAAVSDSRSDAAHADAALAAAQAAYLSTVKAAEPAAPEATLPVGCVLCASPCWGMWALLFTAARLELAFGAIFLRLFTVRDLNNIPAELRSQLDAHGVSTILLEREWSLASGVASMCAHGQQDAGQAAFAVATGVFVILVPLLSTATALYCLLKCGRPPTTALRLMHALARFSGLEVVLLAMLLYLSQMDRLITLNLGRAFWALLAYAPALLGSLVCTTRAVRVVEAKQRGGTKEL